MPPQYQISYNFYICLKSTNIIYYAINIQRNKWGCFYRVLERKRSVVCAYSENMCKTETVNGTQYHMFTFTSLCYPCQFVALLPEK